MKIMFLNKAYKALVHSTGHTCKRCMYYAANCAHIPSNICVLYGGFQNANKEIFEI